MYQLISGQFIILPVFLEIMRQTNTPFLNMRYTTTNVKYIDSKQ